MERLKRPCNIVSASTGTAASGYLGASFRRTETRNTHVHADAFWQRRPRSLWYITPFPTHLSETCWDMQAALWPEIHRLFASSTVRLGGRARMKCGVRYASRSSVSKHLEKSSAQPQHSGLESILRIASSSYGCHLEVCSRISVTA